MGSEVIHNYDEEREGLKKISNNILFYRFRFILTLLFPINFKTINPGR